MGNRKKCQAAFEHGKAACTRHLKRRTFFAEESGFFGGAFPSQNGVAVRITSETVDDFFVFQFELVACRRGKAAEKFVCLLVDGRAFAVHQRHQCKLPFRLVQPHKIEQRHSMLRQYQSHAVLGECTGVVAEQVA